MAELFVRFIVKKYRAHIFICTTKNFVNRFPEEKRRHDETILTAY